VPEPFFPVLTAGAVTVIWLGRMFDPEWKEYEKVVVSAVVLPATG
jgi:hypothetical protein